MWGKKCELISNEMFVKRYVKDYYTQIRQFIVDAVGVCIICFCAFNSILFLFHASLLLSVCVCSQNVFCVYI